MRAFLIVVLVLAVLFLGVSGYAYYRDPAGCQKLLTDAKAIVTDITTGAAPVVATVAPASMSVPAPAAHPMKLWTPPQEMPAQSNWTWNTSDGRSFQNVVVNEIGPDTVSITSSLGETRLDISLLSPEIQKRLNYDPFAAESKGHQPGHAADFNGDGTRALAWKLHRPLAWVADLPGFLTANLAAIGKPDIKTSFEFGRMAVTHLQPHAIIICVESPADFDGLPRPVRDRFFMSDDGSNLPSTHLDAPKIVFSNADGTKIFGAVGADQLKAGREKSLDEVLATIPQDAVIPSSSQLSAPVVNASPVPSSANPAPAPAASVGPLSPPAQAVAPVANVAPAAVKIWTPPDVMPAQPNWTWTTSDGHTYQDVVVTKIEPDTVSITHSMGVAHIAINLLPEDIQKQLNYDPHAASQVPTLIGGKLISAAGTPVDAPGASVQYYAIYYSAQWCPPCHAFSPKLVQWYNKFKPAHPNFELIFVSEDHDEASMLAYMKEMAMPWPAVRFADLQHDGHGTFKSSGIEAFAGNGIPDLVLVDAGGNVLSDSYQNGTYIGPEAVVDAMNKLIGGDSPVPLVR